MRKRAYFITGTGTGVGKTFVTAGLCRALLALGKDPGIMKPVETGCRVCNGALHPADAVALKKAARSADPIDEINPYRFGLPVAPSVAARFAGVKISLGNIAKAYKKLCAAHDVMLVEGAGGFMTPLTGTRTVAELAARLRLPLIIVTSNRLGAINSTLLTVEAAKKRGFNIAGVVLNSTETLDRNDKSIDTNADEITRHSAVPVIAQLPRIRARDGMKNLSARHGLESAFNDMAAKILQMNF